MPRPALLSASLIALAACTPGAPDVARLEEPARIAAHGPGGPPDAPEGSCWARDETPARFETVTEHVIVTPARLDARGEEIAPAETRQTTRQELVADRQEIWFETPCPDSFTPDAVATLQRALKARGVYAGAVTGELDAATRSAIRDFQKPQGLNSSVLSLVAARQLGLVPIALPERQEG